MNNRITINFNHKEKLYSVHYMPSYYDKKYIGHRYEKIMEAGGTVEGCFVIDRPIVSTTYLEGQGIEIGDRTDFGVKLMGAMVYVKEIDTCFPYWLIKPEISKEA